MKTNLQVLNEISAKLGGGSDAVVVTEALNNIANALGDTEPDKIKTISESLEDILKYIGGSEPTGELLFEGDVTTESVDGDVLYVFNPSVKMNYSSLIVEFDGTKYTVPNVANVGKPENLYFEFGAPYDYDGGDQYVWTDYPFNLYYGPNDNDISQIFTESTGTYSLKIWANSDPVE